MPDFFQNHQQYVYYTPKKICSHFLFPIVFRVKGLSFNFQGNQLNETEASLQVIHGDHMEIPMNQPVDMGLSAS